jgi:hypothetical protein
MESWCTQHSIVDGIGYPGEALEGKAPTDDRFWRCDVRALLAEDQLASAEAVCRGEEAVQGQRSFIDGRSRYLVEKFPRVGMAR